MLCTNCDFAVEALRGVKLPGNVHVERGISPMPSSMEWFRVKDRHCALLCCKFHRLQNEILGQYVLNEPKYPAWCNRQWNLDRIACVWAMSLAHFAWHLSRLFYEYGIIIRSFSSLFPSATPLIGGGLHNFITMHQLHLRGSSCWYRPMRRSC